MNLNKSCGNDFAYPDLLRNQALRDQMIKCIQELGNKKFLNIPDYWRETRLVLLAKDENEFAKSINTRPIAV